MISAEVQAALIQAGGTVLAAAVGVWLWRKRTQQAERRARAERQLELKDEADRRNQRVFDLVTAIHSEIVAGLSAAGEQLTPEEAEYAVKQVTPFATPDETDFVFDAMERDITILPDSVIHSVVQYYRIARQSNLMTRDLRHKLFLEQKNVEKQKFVRTLLAVVELQKFWGEAALEDLEHYAAEQGRDLKARRNRAEDVFNHARQSLAAVFTQSDVLDQTT